MLGKKNNLTPKQLDELFIDRLYSACKYLGQDASWYFDKPISYARRMMDSADRLAKLENEEMRKVARANTNKHLGSK